MNKEARTTRRSLLVAIATVPVAGCASEYGLDYKTLKQSFGVAFGLADAPAISLQQAADVPYASIGYRLGNSQEAMLVLTAKSGEGELWTSSRRRALETRGGRIVRSGGFPWNLGGCGFPSGDPVAAGLQESLPTNEVDFNCDYPDLARFGVGIRGQFERRGVETIEILGQPISTTAIIEKRQCEDLDWEFQNTFWVDQQSGFIWRSIQTIHPNLDPITTEVLRPPA